MRIVIDARVNENCGIKRYIENLVNELHKIDNTNEFYILREAKKINGINFAGVFGYPGDNFFSYRTYVKWMSASEQFELPKLLKELKADVYHATSFVCLRNCPVPQVITIHDLIHILFPEQYGWKQKLYYKFIVKPALRKAPVIITDSKNTARDVAKHMGVSIEKIATIYLGVEDKFKVMPEIKKRRFVLNVGNFKPHKNFDLLHKALRMFEKKSGVPCSWTYVRNGNITDDELIRLYNEAELFVMPSLYEGFGLPALEAMACGTPVICSNRASLPEVVGEAAIKVNPEDAKELAHAIEQVLYDKKLAETMIVKGLKQASRFNWRKTAEETLKVYDMARKKAK